MKRQKVIWCPVSCLFFYAQPGIWQHCHRSSSSPPPPVVGFVNRIISKSGEKFSPPSPTRTQTSWGRVCTDKDLRHEKVNSTYLVHKFDPNCSAQEKSDLEVIGNVRQSFLGEGEESTYHWSAAYREFCVVRTFLLRSKFSVPKPFTSLPSSFPFRST